MSNSQFPFLLILILIFSSVTFGSNAENNRSKKLKYLIGNKYINRSITVVNDKLNSGEIINQQTKTSYKFKDDFKVLIDNLDIPITASNSTIVDIKQKGKERIIVELANSGLKGAKMYLIYELKEDDFFGRKWLEIVPEKDQEIPAAVVSVEHLKFENELIVTSSGYGQPIYTDNLFFGLEWPVANNEYSDNSILCSHKPGYNISEPFKSKTAVWGATPSGRVKEWFLEKYLPSIRKTPVRSSVLYNSWYDVRELNQAVIPDFEKTVSTFKQKLETEQEINIDFFVPDDGWQNRNSIYQSDDEKAHMHLRDVVEDELNTANLGIWMPIHGCRAFDMNWAKENAYAAANPKIWGSATMCLSMPKYRVELEKRLKEIIVDERITYFKHDNNQMTCANPNHGHRANSDSQIEEMSEIMDYMKLLDPNVYLNYTTGMNLSPWWLMGADCIWMGGGDVGFSEIGNKREQAISYRDSRMRANEKAQFPNNSLMTHGIIKGKYMMGFQNEDIQHWMNYVWMFVGRGVSMYELYLSPDYLSNDEWDFLGETLKWSLNKSDILNNNTSFVLGDVRNNEAYGYAHTKGDEAILFIRNPSDNLVFDENSKLIVEDWKTTESALPFNKEVVQAKFDDDNWKSVKIKNSSVPATKAKHLAYRSKFIANRDWTGKTVRIHFGGVDEKSEIFLNGEKIAEHSGSIGVKNADGNEMMNNWHYNYKSYYNYNASGFYVDLPADSFDFENENVLAVTLNNWGKVGGVYNTITIRAIKEKTKTTASLVLDPIKNHFDSAYKSAEIEWIYSETNRGKTEVKVGQPFDFDLKPFEVNVIKVKFKK